MKFLFDFFPVLAFFIAFYIPEDREQGIYLATAVAIAASFLQVSICWLLYKKVQRMHLVTFGLLLVLGSATLLLRDERFIMWKPTAVYWLFALVFLGSQYIGKQSLIRRMMGEAISVPDPVWTRLNLAWVGFFILMGLVNLYVAFTYSREIWVNFKLFGMMGMMLVFAVAQAIYLSRHISEPADGDQEN